VLQPLPVFATYRADPTSSAVETVVREVFSFIEKQQPVPQRKAGVRKFKVNPALQKDHRKNR
jgi:hypothetical protein